MKMYHFPPITLSRLVRESVSGFYLRRIKFPDPDRPFTARSGDDALARIRQYVWDAKVTPFIWMWTPIDCLHEEHSNSKMTELNGPLRQLNPLNPRARIN